MAHTNTNHSVYHPKRKNLITFSLLFSERRNPTGSKKNMRNAARTNWPGVVPTFFSSFFPLCLPSVQASSSDEQSLDEFDVHSSTAFSFFPFTRILCLRACMHSKHNTQTIRPATLHYFYSSPHLLITFKINQLTILSITCQTFWDHKL